MTGRTGKAEQDGQTE
jgi:hypothetical protein